MFDELRRIKQRVHTACIYHLYPQYNLTIAQWGSYHKEREREMVWTMNNDDDDDDLCL